MIVYGPVNNPSVTIGNHLYNVNCEVDSSEYLVIDSIEREIYIISNFGEKKNVFNKRNNESYIFQKINHGINSVIWSGGFGFDITVYDERSEPEWI